MSKITAEELEELLSDDFDVRHYSGRSMFGKECPGFVVDKGDEIGEIAAFIGFEPDQERREKLAEVFQDVETDSMGKNGTIIYFPRIAYGQATDD